MSKFTLMSSPLGYALYSEGSLTATWGVKDGEKYVLSQAKMRLGPMDLLVEDMVDGDFPPTLPKAPAPKPKAPTVGKAAKSE